MKDGLDEHPVAALEGGLETASKTLIKIVNINFIKSYEYFYYKTIPKPIAKIFVIDYFFNSFYKGSYSYHFVFG